MGGLRRRLYRRGWDYVEPVMFSYAASEVIETLYNFVVRPWGMRAVAQFHEWMTGAGLLGLKKRAPEIGTVFTTHATTLPGGPWPPTGWTSTRRWTISRRGRRAPTTSPPSVRWRRHRPARGGLFHHGERDYRIGGEELPRQDPDLITPNGLDIENIPDLAADRTAALKSREKRLPPQPGSWEGISPPTPESC